MLRRRLRKDLIINWKNRSRRERSNGGEHNIAPLDLSSDRTKDHAAMKGG
jgi:hypothetical protein